MTSDALFEEAVKLLKASLQKADALIDPICNPEISQAERNALLQQHSKFGAEVMGELEPIIKEAVRQKRGEELMQKIYGHARKTCDEPSCKNKSGIWKCSLCTLARYCGKECQTKHWPTHKLICKKLQERVADLAGVESFEQVDVKKFIAEYFKAKYAKKLSA